MIATSDDWGVSKPDRWVLRAVAKATPCEPDEMLYVGDRLDNDIRPAVSGGFQTALIRRGPWATIQQDDPDADAGGDDADRLAGGAAGADRGVQRRSALSVVCQP